MQKKSFLAGKLHGFDKLFRCRRTECRYGEYLRGAAYKNCRPVCPEKRADFGVQVADFIEFPSVNPLSVAHGKFMRECVNLGFKNGFEEWKSNIARLFCLGK